jgi:hypothetical protein
MAATLYAKSIFGEDALANLSIEKPIDNPNSPVTGHIRIRAKSQVKKTNMISLLLLISPHQSNPFLFAILLFFSGNGIESR